MIRMVSDENGRLLEVTLGSAEYKDILRTLARSADWETLPSYLQDAIDHLLADEARDEAGEALPLRQALAETGDLLL
jgi:hypothetical protein